MKAIHYYIALLCVGVLALASCGSDDDDYTPAEPVKAGCQQVHFASSNDNTAILSANESARQVELLCVRNTTTGTLTVPVEISSTAGVTAAAEVSFADGDSTAYLTVTAPTEVTMGNSYAYEVRLTGDEVDPYAKTDGSNIFSGQIAFPTLRTATMSIGGHSSDLGYWSQEVFDLGGGQYYISDLMHSGVKLWLTVNADGTLGITCPNIDDLCIDSNVYDTGDQLIYLCDPENDYAYYTFYPKGLGQKPVISAMELYNASGYSGWVESGSYFYICLATLQINAGAEEYWKYLYIQFE